MLFITEILDILPSRDKIRRLDAERDRAKVALATAETALQRTKAGADARATAIAESALSEAQAAFDGFDYMPRAIRWLDSHGAYHRFVQYGTRPAHVRPAVAMPVRGYAAAVAEIRERMAKLDATAKTLDDAVAAGELTEAWRDLHLTDISIARLALERIEESVICAAADHGVSIARRPDLDPAALLEVERV